MRTPYLPSYATIRSLCVAAVILLAGCSPKVEARVVHTVVVWLKDPGNEAHRNLIIDETKKMRAIPGIAELTVGPCIRSERAVVDSSFDVALTMTFPSVQAIQAYIRDPRHDAILKQKVLPLVARLQIFDYEASTD